MSVTTKIPVAAASVTANIRNMSITQILLGGYAIGGIVLFIAWLAAPSDVTGPINLKKIGLGLLFAVGYPSSFPTS